MTKGDRYEEIIARSNNQNPFEQKRRGSVKIPFENNQLSFVKDNRHQKAKAQ